MRTHITAIIALAFSLVAVGCDKNDETATADHAHEKATADHDHETTNDDHAHEGDHEHAEGGHAHEGDHEHGEGDHAHEDDDHHDKVKDLEKVEVTEKGEKFDPAIQPEQLPADAWYCDLGTAHWAGMTKPDDGKCPVCGADLKQYDPEKRAAQKEKAVEEHDHHEGGHGHDDGEHGHSH